MTTADVIQKYQALSSAYHGAGADEISLQMYNAGYEALGAAIGGREILNKITSDFAAGEELLETVEEYLPKEATPTQDPLS